MATKTLAQAAIITGFSPALLKKLVSYAPKYGHNRKLQVVQRRPEHLFDENELHSFKAYLEQPWPKPPKSKRPTIPSYIIADIKAECHYRCAICGDMNNGEVAHIDAVSKTVNNSPDNLLLLCPNHHTQYDLGYRASSNIAADDVRAAKAMARNARRRALRFEANATGAYLAVIEKLRRIREMLNLDAATTYSPEYTEVLETHLLESMRKLPELRSAAHDAATKDETFERVEALASVTLDKIPALELEEEHDRVLEFSKQLNLDITGVDLSAYQPIECPVCDGSGKHLGQVCNLCDGEGRVEAGLLEQDIDLSLYEAVECPVCRGSGKHLSQICYFCNGDGSVERGALERH